MRDEARTAVRDRAVGLADAHAGRVTVDHPGSDDGPVAVEVGQRPPLLVAERLVVFLAAVRPVATLRVDADRGALTAEERLRDVLAQVARGVEVGRKQVGVARVEVPQRREQRLRREGRTPQRLDPAHAGTFDVGAEGLDEQVLPRVQRVTDVDRERLAVDEAARVDVQADVGQVEQARRRAGLIGGVREVGERGSLFDEVQKPREVNVVLPGGHALFPRTDEPLVDRVPLVEFGKVRLVPGPLGNGRLDEHRRGVAVDLEHLGGAVACEAQVETGV